MALESGGISRGSGEWGHPRWLWRVGASTGGSVECGHHQGLWIVGASPGGFGE